MKHPKSNLCVDFIIEYSKAKSSAEEGKACKRYEDILFSHFENPDRVNEKEKRSDLNLLVAMTMFGHHPTFLGDYAIQMCESDGESLKNECFVALAAMENLGTVFDEKVHAYIWADFLSSAEKGPSLRYLSEAKASWSGSTLAARDGIMLRHVLAELIEIMFSQTKLTRPKLLALNSLRNFCKALDVSVAVDMLALMQVRCVDDDVLFVCCEEVPGLIEFVCELINRCAAAKERSGDSPGQDLKPLWNCGGCGGAASMSMAISLCLDVTVHDFMSLETSDIGEFLVINTKITKLFSVLEAINNFYKPGEHVLRFDEFGPDDMKRLVQSENITYAAIQKLYGMFPVDRKNISSVWGRIRLTKVVEKVDREAISPHGPDYTMRGHYAFTSLIIAAIKYQCNAFNNYAYSKSFVGSEGVVLNLDFASKMDLLWISDLSCLDSALIWLIALLNNHDVNIRACGLLSLTDLMQKYDIVSMLRVISVLTEKDTSDPKLKLSVKGLISMREKILMYLYTIVEYLLNSIERDKITDVDSIRCAIDFLLMYGGLITAERAKEQAPQDALDFQYSDTRLQTIMLSKAAESPASAAERGVASSSLEQEIQYYSVRRREYVRALALISQKLYILSMASLQRAAPQETLILFRLMNCEGLDRMVSSEATGRPTFPIHQSVPNVGDVAANNLQSLWLLPKPSTAYADVSTYALPDQDSIRPLLDLWHVSSSHKHLLGSINSMNNSILKYWESTELDFIQALSSDCGVEEAPVTVRIHETPGTPAAADCIPKASPDSEMTPKLSLLSPGFSFSSFSNILNRYNVTIVTAEYLSIKCDAAGRILFGQATGVVSVSSKVNETTVTKISCNICEDTVFCGTSVRDFLATVSISSVKLNERIIRSFEANGIFFITSQPGSFPDTDALEYTFDLTSSRDVPPLQIISECSASIVSKNADEINAAVVSGGEIGVVISFIYKFINTCDDRDITDMIADIPLPPSKSVLSCVTESVTKGKIISKYDTGKRALFVRIPKLKKSAELILKATIELDGVIVGMLQNNYTTSVMKSRGFYLSAAPALLGFSLSNSQDEKYADYHFSLVKFELPLRASSGMQPGSLSRSISSRTYIKSYSCGTSDIFVPTVSVTNSISRGVSGTYEGCAASSDDREAVVKFLKNTEQSSAGVECPGDAGELVDGSDMGGIIVVTKDTLFSSAKPCGLPPPLKPHL